MHAQEIELGLDRVRAVYGHLAPLSCSVITVGGTNGKGSTTAFLEAIYLAAGYRVGAYFSPHLWRYNERIRLDGHEVEDAVLCQAFAKVEAARGDIPLTYFEFGTLAALVLFAQAACDVVILEVGLGGRLDAVNIIDCDVAVVVSVGTDHKDWLGPDRETIGREKAGIFRAHRPAVIGFDVSESVHSEAARLGALACVGGRDFHYTAERHQWRYVGVKGVRDLPYPALRGSYQLANAACALAAVDALPMLAVSAGALRSGLQDVRLAGRFQSLPGRPRVVVDVAHNEEAAIALAHALREPPAGGRTLAVVGMLKDKPIAGVFRTLLGSFDDWFVATLADPRGADGAFLGSTLAQLGRTPYGVYEDPVAAYEAALMCATPDDRVVVFGSFKTVGVILEHETSKRVSGGGRAI
ncbi:MAG: bifunctional tetrahydrofolate synthase/dihydrofolate synthase [Acidiferrobacter sp.]